VVDFAAALGQQFLDVPVGQAEAQLPADRYDHDIGWEAEAGEGRPSASNGIRRRGSCWQSACSGPLIADATAPRRLRRGDRATLLPAPLAAVVVGPEPPPDPTVMTPFMPWA
jgi:hypothetical protein